VGTKDKVVENCDFVVSIYNYKESENIEFTGYFS